jgi:hypothetical protein
MDKDIDKKNYSTEIAEISLKRAIEQMDEYDKTKNPALLNIAYANVGFALWYGLDVEKELERLKNYGMDVKKIKKWKPAKKIDEKHFGVSNN